SELIDECIENSKVILSLNEKTKLKRRIQDDIIGLGPLTDLMNDSSITDIMINGPKEVWVEKDGQMIKENIEFTDDNQLMNIVYRITSKINRHVDEHSPMLDARMPDGSRINIILPPLAVNGPSLSIRKFSNDGFSLEKLVSSGALSSEAADLLASKIANKKNILITGGTGTGKTTMLQALAEKINRSERVISIEDTAELKLSQPNLVSLECRPPNIEDRGAISIRQLLRNSLRMRPDRIIIGEVRGAEAGDMLQAMNTGHEGCMGTIHANSPADAVQRFENMICMDQQYLPGLPTRRQIYNVIDVVVHMGRSPEGKRCVLKIAEIKELNGESILMRNVYEHGNDDQEIENPEKTGDQNGKRLFAS
ncbi:MAG: CpaF family protein, partial [Gammaproteobacteria bacterium]|nr:CpaF family protein [Gammaproteobacteria bacterium]